MQHIYNAIFTGVCKVSLQKINKPGRNSTWMSDLSIDNQEQICQNINHMDSVPQGQKRVQPSLFNIFEPKNKLLSFPGQISSQIHPTILKSVLVPNLPGQISSEMHHTKLKIVLTTKQHGVILSQIHHTISKTILQAINQIF